MAFLNDLLRIWDLSVSSWKNDAVMKNFHIQCITALLPYKEKAFRIPLHQDHLGVYYCDKKCLVISKYICWMNGFYKVGDYLFIIRAREVEITDFAGLIYEQINKISWERRVDIKYFHQLKYQYPRNLPDSIDGLATLQLR